MHFQKEPTEFRKNGMIFGIVPTRKISKEGGRPPSCVWFCL